MSEGPDEIDVCPHCGSSQVQSNSGGWRTQYDDVPPYRCDSCGEGFEEPEQRPPLHDHDTRTGLARKLARMGEEREDAGV